MFELLSAAHEDELSRRGDDVCKMRRQFVPLNDPELLTVRLTVRCRRLLRSQGTARASDYISLVLQVGNYGISVAANRVKPCKVLKGVIRIQR
jgi:hypothetical protein